MEVTRMAAWAVVSLCAVAAVYGFAKVVVAWLCSLDDADEEPEEEEEEEADDARGA